jgi:DNA topoisomerase VI subunit B
MESPTLNRTTHVTDRVMDFFTEEGLRTQIGLDRQHWPLAILKELLDNSLDACESTRIIPEVTVEIGEDYFAVKDNGPGIAADTVTTSLDFSTRVSDKARYVSPTRGQLGNALKIIYAAPLVVNGSSRIEIHSAGILHTIDITLDRLAQTPTANHEISESEFVKNGTFLKVVWPDLACSIVPFAQQGRQLVEKYAIMNPGASFYLDLEVFGTADQKFKKWKPNDPTAPIWYTNESLTDLIAAYLTIEIKGGASRTVRDFVSEFRGLSGSAKQKQVISNFKGAHLRDLVKDGEVDKSKVETLLSSMQGASAEPEPKVLGVIGKPHFYKWMKKRGVAEESMRYTKCIGKDGLPYVLEVAFGILEKKGKRQVITGLNFTPTLKIPTEDIIDEALIDSRIEFHDPVILIVHITRPRFDFTDPGKTKVHLSDELGGHLTESIALVTKDWRKLKKKQERKECRSEQALKPMKPRLQKVTIRDAAFQVMEHAYMKASDNEKYPANARQIYYAARPFILRETGEEQLDSQYFTQALLKDYIDEYEPSWDVVFDSRGHFIEPHTNVAIGLGGIDVREYIDKFTNGKFDEAPHYSIPSSIPTRGSHCRYGGVLFIEKEGFDPLLRAARIAERYDLAIASTKGMPVAAACDLMGELKEHDCRVYVVRDFDKAGFSIVETLRKGARGSRGFGEIIDLGLRLDDIEGLERETVSYKSDPTDNLKSNGATDKEIEVLLKERVELNSMTAGRFIKWIEQQLDKHEVKKVIPDENVLASAFRRATFLQRLDDEVKKIHQTIMDEVIVVPQTLAELVRQIFLKKTDIPWDDAVWLIAESLKKKV